MIKNFSYLFSLPILVGIIAGILFPFQALELIFLNNFLLFALLFLNSLSIETDRLFTLHNTGWRESLFFLGVNFVFLPCVLINLCQLLLQDSNLIFGFTLSTLAPTAFVAPYFCKLQNGNANKSLWYIAVSTFFFPCAIFIYFSLLVDAPFFINTPSILRLVLLITFLPILLGLACARLFPVMRGKLYQTAAPVNSMILALLMFILCGSSLNKFRFSSLQDSNLLILTLLLIILDFGLYYFIKFFASHWFDTKETNTLAVSVSLKNLAIPASLLLSFQPKAAIVPALGLIVHAFFFQWLSLRDRTRKPSGS